jgi:hypothetical protein
MHACSCPASSLSAHRSRSSPRHGAHLAAALAAPWAVAAVLAFRPAQYEQQLANGFALPKSAGKVTTNHFGWGEGGPGRLWYEGPAVYYQTGVLQFARADIEIRGDLEISFGTFGGVGLVSYAMGPEFHVLDLHGLADAVTAHLDPTPDTPQASRRWRDTRSRFRRRGSRRSSHRQDRARTPRSSGRHPVRCSHRRSAASSTNRSHGRAPRWNAMRS